MRMRVLCCLAMIGVGTSTAWGQPKEWSDDFSAVATYDSDSLEAPCTGGASTKYTVFEALRGDIYTQRAVSGGGRLVFTNRDAEGIALTIGRIDLAIIGVMNFGQGCPDVAGIGMTEGTEPFTSQEICVYGGIVRHRWHLTYPPPNDPDIRGTDGQPGVANVDDDLDGNTDENDESPANRATTAGGGYGWANETGFPAGRDAAPGVAGVDDDANGIVDDLSETGWSGSDDSDDTQWPNWLVLVDVNPPDTQMVFLCMNSGSTRDKFSIREIVGGSNYTIQYDNEIARDFFQPMVHYNWVLCNSGTCYGAMLWTGTDIANPDETVGPSINSRHTGPGDNLVGFGYNHYTNPVPQYLRKMRFYGNTNFSDKFWVISGNPAQYYPSPSADLDADRDVDGFDFLTFSNCYNGSNKAPLAACANTRADLDRDGDVDGFDFLTFSNCYNGSNRKPLTACFPPNLTACGS